MILVCLSGSQRVAADEVIYSPDYIAVLPGYSLPSKAYLITGSGFTLSAVYGHQVRPHWSIEANLQTSVFETGANKGTDFYQNGGTVDVVYSLWDRHTDHLLIPFVLAGVGGVYDDFYPDTRDGVALILNAGIGVVSRPLLSTGIRFRLDARYVRDSHEGGHAEPRFIAGIEIPLGRVIRQLVSE
jgi:OmpA-OmpF porin, OOP family